MRRSKEVIVIIAVLSFFVPFQKSFCQGEGAEKEAILRGVAGQWVAVGIEEYNRGMYLQAETAFLSARDYYLHMSKEQRTILEEYSERTHQAYIEVISLSKQVENARQLFEEMKLIEAYQTVSQINSNEFLTEIQRQQFKLGELEEQIQGMMMRRQRQVDEVFALSVQAYRNGEFESAKRGFSAVVGERLTPEVQRTAAEGYIERIDRLLKRERTPFIEAEQLLEERPAEQSGAKVEKEPSLFMPVKPALPKVEPVPVKVESPVRKPAELTRKEKLLRSYSQAVVNDATKKAQTFIEVGDVFKAQQAIRNAERTVNENRDYLGEELYQAYVGQLNELWAKIE
jgi:hypothetical protein